MLETAYCAEVLAATYQGMGLLDGRHRTNWYDAGRFWSGDELQLAHGYQLGGEIAVTGLTGTSGRARRPAGRTVRRAVPQPRRPAAD